MIMKKASKFFTFFVISLVFCSLAFPQAQTGSIKGTINDPEGNPLPGASVSVLSPSLMGTQTYISTEAGAFRFPALPPGTYAVTVEMPGFKKVLRENIVVRVGMVVTIDFTMEVTSLQEEITVTAPSPTIDVRQTKIVMDIDRALLENVPISRDLADVVLAAPGTVREGATGRQISVHGTSVKGSSYAFDGVNMFDPVNGSVMSTLNVDSMEEVELITAALPAEVGFTEGGYINVVTRSGGNNFSGSALVYYTNKNLAQSMWTDEQAMSMGVKQPSVDKNWIDGALNIGGPLLKDRLWFYANGRYTKQIQTSNFIPFTDILGRSHEGRDWEQTQYFGYGKLTFQLSSKLKLSGMFNYLKIKQPGGTTSPYGTFISTRIYDRDEYAANSVLNYILDQNTFVDLKFTYAYTYYISSFQPEAMDLPYIQDYGTPYGSITNARYNEAYTRERIQAGPTFTRFQDNFLGGSHEIKGGADWELSSFIWDAFRKYGMMWYFNKGPYYYNPTTRQGQTNFGFYPAEEGGLPFPAKVQRLGGFLQDSITFGKRLTLTVGLRFDYFNGWVPAFEKAAVANPLNLWVGENVIRPYVIKNYSSSFPNGLNPFGKLTFEEWPDILSWTTLSPRLGLTFDVFGNGKTALKMSYNQYSSYMRMELYAAAHPYAPSWGWFSFYWTDTNANGEPDTGDAFESFPTDYRRWDLKYAAKTIDPDTKSPINEEVTVGLYQELFKDFSAGVNFIYKDQKNVGENALYNSDTGEYWYHPDLPGAKKYYVPFTTIVPGTGGYPNQTVTIYARKNDAPGVFTRFTDVPELKRKYWALEFVFNKRMSNGWQFSGSIVSSKAYGNMGSYWNPSWGWSEAADDANFFVNSYGRIDVDRPLVLKLMGTVQLPLGILFSSYYRHSSGTPWARTASILIPQKWAQENNAYWTGGNYVTVYVEPLGSRRESDQDILDVRIEKEFVVSDFGKLGIFLDVFNLLGWSYVNVGKNDVYRYKPSAPNVAEAQNITLSPSYKRISSVDGLRTVKLSVRFRF